MADFIPSSHATLRQFFDLDTAKKWSFDTNEGVHCEGFAIEVEVHRVLFAFAGPMAPDEPEWISFDRLGIEKLSYWDDQKQRWLDFSP